MEEPLDILALERAGAYKGLYHVLHGVISPMDGIGPEDLKVQDLLGRLRSGDVHEVIMAAINEALEETRATQMQQIAGVAGGRNIPGLTT